MHHPSLQNNFSSKHQSSPFTAFKNITRAVLCQGYTCSQWDFSNITSELYHFKKFVNLAERNKVQQENCFALGEQLWWYYWKLEIGSIQRISGCHPYYLIHSQAWTTTITKQNKTKPLSRPWDSTHPSNWKHSHHRHHHPPSTGVEHQTRAWSSDWLSPDIESSPILTAEVTSCYSALSFRCGPLPLYLAWIPDLFFPRITIWVQESSSPISGFDCYF